MTNERVLRSAGVERQLIRTIRFRELNFLGHCVRRKELEHFLLTAKIVGSKTRGRKRMSFLKSLDGVWEVYKFSVLLMIAVDGRSS